MKLIYLALVFLAGAAQAALPAVLQGDDLATGRPATVPLKSGALTVVAFVSARCPCSQSYEAALRQLAREFPEDRFIGLHANANEPEAEAKRHFAAAGLGFPVVQDPASKWADAFGAFKTPHVYVVDAAGNVVYAGGVGDSRKAEHMKTPVLREALLALRAGKKPEHDTVRVLGCAIERP